MPSSRSYLSALYRRFQLLGAWPPNQRVEVGEVGVIEGGAFRRRTTLGNLGIPFTASSTGQVGDLDYSEGAEIRSNNDTNAGLLVGGGAPRVGVAVKLDHEGAFVFNALGVLEWRLDDVIAVERHVLAALGRGAWDPSWVIVDRVMQASSLTVIISESSGAELGLSANASAGLQTLKLGDANLGLSTDYANGQCLRFLGEVGFTPLYQCLRVAQHLLSRNRLETAGPLSFGLDEEPEAAPPEEDAPAGSVLEKVGLDFGPEEPSRDGQA